MGQRKLLLAEIEFLCYVLETAAIETILVVYAGAANGSHLPTLFSLFPSLRFVLIDPAPFCAAVYSLAKEADGPIVELINDYCSDELCARLRRDYSESHQLVFISDVRSGDPLKMSNQQHTEMIRRDSKMQLSWACSLQSSAVMLKFHPPYPRVSDSSSNAYDPSDTTPDEFEYLKGDLLFGVWAPKSSSEVRLVARGPFRHGDPLTLQKYSCIVHEEQCCAYNDDRYAKDVEAEREILSRYAKRFSRLTVEEISSKISSELGHAVFQPLTQGFTEDHARLAVLLLHAREVDLFQSLRDVITWDFLLDAVRKRLRGSITDNTIPPIIWKFATSKVLSEAYSFPPFRVPRLSGSKRQLEE